MVNSQPDFCAVNDGTSSFLQFLDFDQNNLISKFYAFWANISVYMQVHEPKFRSGGVILDS